MSARAETRRARKVYRDAHWGIEATRELQMRGPAGVPKVTVQLGALVDIELVNGALVRPQGRVHLAFDEAGRRLFLLANDKLQHEGPGGRIEAITYRTKKDDGGQVFRHAFDQPGPVLAVNKDGWPVIRRGGSKFKITWRGIEA